MLICELALPIVVSFYIGLSLIISAIILAVILFIKKYGFLKQLLVISIFAAFGIGLWTVENIKYQECQHLYEGQELYLTLQIVEEPEITKNGYYLYTAVPIGEAAPFKYKITFNTFTYQKCEVYDNVRGLFLLNKSLDVYGDYNRSLGIAFSARVVNTEEIEFITKNINDKPFNYLFFRIKGYVSEILDEYTGLNSAFTKSIMLGDISGLSSNDYNALKNSGLLHIVSVSGLHVSILTAIILMLLSSIKKKRFRYILCFVFLFILAGVCGFSPSVMRAVFMTGITFIGKFTRRRADPLNAFGAAVLIMLIFSPFLVISPSFLLSFSATLGMLLLHKPIMKVVSTFIFNLFNYVPDTVSYNIISAFILSLSCTIFTLPISIYFFGSFSFMGIISNVLIMSVINITFTLCVLIVLIGWIPIVSSLAFLFAFIVNWGVVYIMAVTKFISGFTYSIINASSFNMSIEILVIALIVGLITFILLLRLEKNDKNHKRNEKRHYIKIVIPVFVVLILITASIFLQKIIIEADNLLTLTFINVGQGECAAIMQKDSAIIVDCGGSLSPGENTVAYLMKNGIKKIPLVILSHLHEDHTNGLAYLCEIYDIDEIVIPFTEGDPSIYVEISMIAAQEGAKLTVIEKDEERIFDETSIKMLTNHFIPTTNDQNENSIVIITELGNFKAMLTGDITSPAENRLIDYGALLDVDLLNIPHHGSNYSTSEDLLLSTTPILSVISVGKNSYGHPSSEVINRLISYGDVLITRDCGYVEIKTDGLKMNVYKESK